jgi:predicted RNA-binding Zn-ribbon protein involved in translation (DUF1610 family)
MAGNQEKALAAIQGVLDKGGIDVTSLSDIILATMAKQVEANMAGEVAAPPPPPTPQVESTPTPAVTPQRQSKSHADELFERFHQENPNVPKEAFMKALANAVKCPMCGSYMVRMDASQRGRAFGQGNLLGAFAKTYRCDSCGYLA